MDGDDSDHFVPFLKGRNWENQERVYIINFYLRYSSSTFGYSALLLCNGGSMEGGRMAGQTQVRSEGPKKVWIYHCCVGKRNSFFLTLNLNILSNGNSIWDFVLDVLFICTCLPQNLLPARIVLLLGVEGHYHYWDGIFPCLPAKLRMAKYTYQLCVALGQ